MNITINATMRKDQGKGASRRLRHQEQVTKTLERISKAPEKIAEVCRLELSFSWLIIALVCSF
jgi:hypothetical protein